MTEHQVEICPVEHRVDPERPRRVRPGDVICGGCKARLERSLRDMPALFDELGESLGGGKHSGGAGPVSGSSETKLPISPVLADHRAHMKVAVMLWCLAVSDEYGVTLPTDPELAVTCPWLLVYTDWSARQYWAPAFVTEVRHLAGRARGLLDPQEQQNIVLGACVETDCPGSLWGTFREDDPAPWLIECDETGRTWPTDQWLSLGRQIMQKRTA